MKAEKYINDDGLRKSYPFVLGYWDQSSEKLALGTLLIFLVECQMLTLLCNADAIDIALNAESYNEANVPEGSFRILSESDNTDPAISILRNIDSVRQIYLCGGGLGFKALTLNLNSTHLIWPLVKHNYDTTLHIQKLWKIIGRIQSLNFNQDIQYWANNLLRSHFENYPLIGLHLKRIIGYDGNDMISQADQSIWYEFLLEASLQYKIKFILLGDDPVNPNIKRLPNVAIAREIGADNFAKHLALLSKCSGFMGMMSSICNFVIFSDIPYAIFKNPSHHKNEMDIEIGKKNYYPFANQFQKVFRAYETKNLLLSQLKGMPFVKE